MYKTIKVNNKEYNLCYTFRTMLEYKVLYENDFMLDIKKLEDTNDMVIIGKILTAAWIAYLKINKQDMNNVDTNEILNNLTAENVKGEEVLGFFNKLVGWEQKSGSSDSKK